MYIDKCELFFFLPAGLLSSPYFSFHSITLSISRPFSFTDDVSFFIAARKSASLTGRSGVLKSNTSLPLEESGEGGAVAVEEARPSAASEPDSICCARS
jgi:hypothetical protein